MRNKTYEEERQELVNSAEQAGQQVAAANDKLDAAGLDYQSWLNSQQPKMETDVEKSAREKRERRARRIAAITDGIVGLSNIIGAANGATAFKQPSMSDAVKRAQKEALAERVANYNRLLARHQAEGARRYQRYGLAQRDLVNAQNGKYRADNSLVKLDQERRLQEKDQLWAEYKKRDVELKAAKDARAAAKDEVTMKALEARIKDMEHKQRIAEAQLGISQQNANTSAYNAQTSRMNAVNAQQPETTVTDYVDKLGRPQQKTVTKYKGGQSGTKRPSPTGVTKKPSPTGGSMKKKSPTA